MTPAPRRARSATLVAAALAAAAAGAVAVRHSRSTSATEGAAPTVGTGPPVAGGLVAGDQRRWKLDFEARMDQRRNGAAEPLTVNLTADWVVTILATRVGADAGWDAACEVASPHVRGGGVEGVAQAGVAALERRMAQRFFVSYRGDGAATQIAFPADVDPGTRNLLQLIVTGTQLVRPAAPSQQWTALERDGAGTYLASYHQAAPDQIIKKKLKYVSVDPSMGAGQGRNGAPGVEMVVDASTRRLTVDERGALTAFEGGDQIRIALPGAMPAGAGAGGQPGATMSMRVSTRLTGLQVARVPELLAPLQKDRAGLEASAIVTHAPSPEEARSRHDRDVTAGARLDDLLRGTASSPPDPRAVERLEAWLRLHADAATATGAAFRAAKPGPATKALGQALGRAGTPAAQAALVALAAESPLAPAARADALVGLMVSERPTVEALRAVAGLIGAPEAQVRQAALLVGGGLAHDLRATAPAEADRFDAALISGLTSARKADDAKARAELMGAIGNSAGPSLLAALGPVLAADTDDGVRAGAARALRLYDDTEARELLARTIASDRAATVRAAAIFAEGFVFDEGDVAPIAKAALGDASEVVRGQATTTLGQHQDAPPDAAEQIRGTLERVAQKDAKPGVRKLAREALARAAQP